MRGEKGMMMGTGVPNLENMAWGALRWGIVLLSTLMLSPLEAHATAVSGPIGRPDIAENIWQRGQTDASTTTAQDLPSVSGNTSRSTFAQASGPAREAPHSATRETTPATTLKTTPVVPSGEDGLERATGPGAPPLSLEQAMRMALERNPNMTQAELQVVLSRLAAQRARLDRFSASIDMAAGESASVAWAPEAKDPIASELGPFSNGATYGVNAQLSIPLYTGGAVAARIGQAETDVKVQEAEQRASQRDLIRAVYQAYWNIGGYDLRVVAAKEALEQTRDALTIIQARLQNGLAAPIELNRFQVDLLSQEQQVAELELQAYSSRQELLRLLNLSGEAVQLTDSARDVPASVLGDRPTPLLERAHQQRVELTSLNLSREVAGYGRLIARADYYPTISLNLEAEAGGTPYWYKDTFAGTDFYPGVGLTAGVNLSWNVFNLGRTAYQVRQADVSIRQIEARYEDQVARIDQEVKTAYQRLRSLQSRQPGVQRQLELARDNLTIIQTLYEQGNASILDLFDAQSAYRNALSQEATQRIELTLAEYELRWTVGDSFISR